jgi:hypothetical protein
VFDGSGGLFFDGSGGLFFDGSGGLISIWSGIRFDGSDRLFLDGGSGLFLDESRGLFFRGSSSFDGRRGRGASGGRSERVRVCHCLQNSGDRLGRVGKDPAEGLVGH